MIWRYHFTVIGSDAYNLVVKAKEKCETFFGQGYRNEWKIRELNAKALVAPDSGEPYLYEADGVATLVR